MGISERLHAKRAATERHVRELEAAGKAGARYAAAMPGAPFFALAVACDVGWLLQLASGVLLLLARPHALVAASLAAAVAGVACTIYLGTIHEKEIALRWQKDASFGLVALGGALGLAAFAVGEGNAVIAVGSALNLAGGLPIYLSFRPGIAYGIR